MLRLYKPPPTRRNLILSAVRWGDRHGSERVQGGRLKACTNTDYLCFSCPECGTVTSSRYCLAWEGYRTLRWIPAALSFRFQCITCGFRDYFKIEVDTEGYLPRNRDPVDWSRPGTNGDAA